MKGDDRIKKYRIESWKKGHLMSSGGRTGGQMWVARDTKKNKIVGKLVMCEPLIIKRKFPHLDMNRYMSSLSVHPEYYGQGIAQKLIYTAFKNPTDYSLQDSNISSDETFTMTLKGFPVAWDMWASTKNAYFLYKKIVKNGEVNIKNGKNYNKTSVYAHVFSDEIILKKNEEI
jgi:predicted N-acetyltransferase YhbS